MENRQNKAEVVKAVEEVAFVAGCTGVEVEALVAEVVALTGNWCCMRKG